jgi:hypothetical protein
MDTLEERWGFNAAGTSGYTKEIALFEKPDGAWQIRVRPSLAAPPIVFDLTNDAARGLRDVLSGYGIA